MRISTHRKLGDTRDLAVIILGNRFGRPGVKS